MIVCSTILSGLLLSTQLVEPAIPPNMRENPFRENVSIPIATSTESRQGMMIFHRPAVEPVWENTRPHPWERISELPFFAARNQYATWNFSVFALRPLNGLKITASSLRCGESEIPAEKLRIERVVIWPVKFPLYSSRGTFRRMPEFLSVADAPLSMAQHTSQRFFLTVPPGTTAVPGVYNGSITVSHDDGTTNLSVRFRLLPFELKQDPAKRYSVYLPWFSDREKLNRSTEHECQTMAAYGLNAAPNVYMTVREQNGKFRLTIPHFELTWNFMRKAGLKPPVPVIDCGFGTLYRSMTGKDLKKHALAPVPVPEELYATLDSMVKEWKEEMRKNQWPEMIFCPLDEIAPQSAEIGKRVYRIFHENGLKTFATKDPATDPSAALLAPYVDVWSTQSYSGKPGDSPQRYWCYPNHNAYELKDPLTMCKGGRMTYGFGNWISGCDTLMPWVWRSANRDHLHPNRDAGGNRMEEDGTLTMTTYWTAFREGIDDARYLYTLQDAIARRQGENDPKLKLLLDRATGLLQELRQVVPRQSKYLADNLWSSTEFDAWRWRLAEMILQLSQYQAHQNAAVPAEMPETSLPQMELRKSDPVLDAIAAETIQRKDLLSGWKSCAAELTLANQPGHLRLSILIDHQKDGEGGKGEWKLGWPRVRRTFASGELNLADYDFLRARLTIRSNRHEEAKSNTPIYLSVHSLRNDYKRDYYIVEESMENTEIALLYPIRKILESSPTQAMNALAALQIGINERQFRDGEKLELDFTELSLIKFQEPVFRELEIPATLLLPESSLSIRAALLGDILPDTRLQATLSKNNRAVTSHEWPAARDFHRAMPLPNLQPGVYQLELRLLSPAQRLISSKKQTLQLLPGPFSPAE